MLTDGSKNLIRWLVTRTDGDSYAWYEGLNYVYKQ